MSTEQVSMSHEQIQLCFAIARGEDKACELASKIPLIPKANVKQEFAKSNFVYCPAIFALWAIQQHDPKVVYQFLAQAYPKEAKEFSFLAAVPTQQEIRQLVQKLIFEPVRKSLLSFLFNVAQLEGSHENDLDRFYLMTSSAALELITSDEFFSDAPTQQLQLANKLLQRLQPIVLLATFDKLLNDGAVERIEESKATPQTVKTLLRSFKQVQKSLLPGNAQPMRYPEIDEESSPISFLRPFGG